MTKGELLLSLADLPDDAPVFLAADGVRDGLLPLGEVGHAPAGELDLPVGVRPRVKVAILWPE